MSSNRLPVDAQFMRNPPVGLAWVAIACLALETTGRLVVEVRGWSCCRGLGLNYRVEMVCRRCPHPPEPCRRMVGVAGNGIVTYATSVFHPEYGQSPLGLH
jgi:hypothetical protein